MKNGKELEELVSMLNSNRSNLEAQLYNYKTENVKLNEQFNEFAIKKKELRSIKDRNLALLNKVVNTICHTNTQ